MIFYFSGTTSGADPERFAGNAATIMMSYMLVADKNKKWKTSNEPTALAPDIRFAEVLKVRSTDPRFNNRKK